MLDDRINNSQAKKSEKKKKHLRKKMQMKSRGKEYLVKTSSNYPSCLKIKQKYPYIVQLMWKGWIELC